ncbi:YciI family protein [Echinicola jeungdonensis]|uniref:YciI family protein n=1 Tax=Echinicola jeungdonensis TaxID=709343 RepID=A0ABV5J4P4_9BACT|nr:YciI family protein [Echinicola jeungdonensis]MDN3670560.1 YciI family protein [Echinicola jeungdonensis]
MKKFIVIYHAPISALEQMENTSPEESKKGMEKWMEWAKKCGDKLVDIGNPLANGEKLSTNGSSEKSKREVCGYSILQAKDMEEAKKLLQGHPHLSGWDAACEIEVHETMPLPE